MSRSRRQADLPAPANPSTASPPDVHNLLRKYRLKPDKSLGQNFLVDQAWLRRVVEAADLCPEDTVLEIGAGLGSLTFQLATTAGRVVAVEFDSHLIPALREAVDGLANVRIVHDDILSIDLDALGSGGEYVVVANIPYNITAALIRKLLEAPHPSRVIVLTVQLEVAERIVSEPGDMSLLALSVHVYGRPAIKARIPAEAFYPRPRVDSAVLRIDASRHPRVAPELIDPLFRMARAGFSQKRKKLANALKSGLGVERTEVLGWLDRAGVPPGVRAQELDLESWERLVVAAQEAIS
jgi:16S rRNA (adenine1518-N6/adenine1519-N6)-dimethyltransferase